MPIEAKAYDRASTPDELEALRSRLSLLRPGLVMYREVPVPSPFQIQVFADRLRRLTAGLDGFSMIMDLSEAKPPGGAVREALRAMFADLPNLREVAVFTGGNFIINSVAKLLLRSSGVRNLTMCKGEAEALALLARA